MKQHFKRIMVYASVGITSTALDIVSLWFLQSRLPVWLAVAVAFGGGTIVNFVLHRTVTFKDTRTTGAATLARYLTVVCTNLLITEIIVLACVHLFAWPPLAAKFLSLPIVLVVGYSLSRFWVFPQKSNRTQSI
jgi:putative flippase GtrA